MNDNNTVRVKIEGEFACFTRPDLKVERMTYPCMTPSAARGILDSILWKPEFKWYIKRILVLKPVQFFSIKRNEINKKQGASPIVADETTNRAQRNSIILKNVAYIIEAEVYVHPYSEKNPPRKYVEQFQRRIKKGQCWRRPYLGCREFSAEFMEPDKDDKPIDDYIPVGSMLLDIFYPPDGKPQPRFFYDVSVRNGVLDCSKEYIQMLESSHPRPVLDEGVMDVLCEFERYEEGKK
jgi:CRISPR-associated protein Cas5d